MTRSGQEPWRLVALLILLLAVFSDFAVASSEPSPPKGSWRERFRLPGKRYTMDATDEELDDVLTRGERPALWVGAGRELSLFDSSSTSTEPASSIRVEQQQQQRGGEGRGSSNYYGQFPPRSGGSSNKYDAASAESDFSSSSNYNYRTTGGRSYTGSRYNRRSGWRNNRSSLFQPVADWWSNNISPNIKNWPKIQCRVEPTTTLKIRKTFRPLKTIVRLSAHFNTQQGVWQFKSSWEDAIIGGKLTLAGMKELQLTKSWQLSVGPVEDLVTRLRLRAAVDLQTWKAYVRVGFRTERLSPINVMEGFSLLKRIPLDGNNGHVKLEIKANFALPEPEIEYSTETQRSLIGMGDIEVAIEELNLLLDY